MFNRIAAATLFLSFVAFVNLAATLTASFNRVETSTVAAIAGIFQAFVDIGAIVIIAILGMRMFVKLAQEAQMKPQPVRVQQTEYRAASQPAHQANPASWNPATPQPLPFDNHGAQEYIYNTQSVQPQPIAQNGRDTKIHQMRTRDGYKMVR